MVADNKYVYFFGGNKTEGKNSLKDLLGGKGANLAEMANLGIPVPPGFTITAEVCVQYLKDHSHPPGLLEQIDAAISRLEEVSGKAFGNDSNPLLVSIRSGSKGLIPGMIDMVLNLGLNDTSVLGLAKNTDNPRFAYDTYRHFLTTFGDVVLGIEHDKFEHILSEKKRSLGVKQDTELDVDTLKELVEQFKIIIEKETGEKFPQDARKQLMMAINAVFESWNSQRAITYRKLNNIQMDSDIAVNVQAMIYGNMEDKLELLLFNEDETVKIMELLNLFILTKELNLYNEKIDPEGNTYPQIINDLVNSYDYLLRVIDGKRKKQTADITSNLDEALKWSFKAYSGALDWLIVNVIDSVTEELKLHSTKAIEAVIPTYYSELRPSLEEIKDAFNILRNKNEESISSPNSLNKYKVMVEKLKYIRKEIMGKKESLILYDMKKKKENLKSDLIKILIGIIVGIIVGIALESL